MGGGGDEGGWAATGRVEVDALDINSSRVHGGWEGFLLRLSVQRSAMVEIATAAGRFKVGEKTPRGSIGAYLEPSRCRCIPPAFARFDLL
jgi:hypothetical protein